MERFCMQRPHTIILYIYTDAYEKATLYCLALCQWSQEVSRHPNEDFHRYVLIDKPYILRGIHKIYMVYVLVKMSTLTGMSEPSSKWE